MIKRILIAALFTLQLSTIYAQGPCEFKSFFPIEFGTSSFDALFSLQKYDFIRQDLEGNRIMAVANNWRIGDFNQSDSVYVSAKIYKYEKFPCFDIDEGSLYFIFADNEFIGNQYYLSFEPSNLQKAENAHKKIIEMFSKDYPVLKEKPILGINDEQIGLHSNFSKDPETATKMESLSVNFSVRYERDYDMNTPEKQTSNVDEYEIWIFFRTLNHEKLNMKKFRWP